MRHYASSAIAATALGLIAYCAGVTLNNLAFVLPGAALAVMGSAAAVICLSTEEEETE
jgi:hypothetical protein